MRYGKNIRPSAFMCHKPDTNVGDDEGDDVAEHVEGVGHEGHRVCPVADDELDQHEAAGHGEHGEDARPGAAARGATQDSRKLHPQSRSSNPSFILMKLIFCNDLSMFRGGV